MPENRSAQWLRGAVEALNRAQRDFTISVPELQAEYVDLLAEAEAREAPEVIPGTREALAGLTIRSQAPTAEKVIAAAERALESVSFECDGKADCDDGLDGVANVPNLAMRCEMAVGPALALITKWKEAR